MSNPSLYALFDMVSGKYENPFLCSNDASAERMIVDFAFANPSHPVVLHRADYRLFALGSFNPEDGVITSDVRFVFSVDTVVHSAELKFAEMRKNSELVPQELPKQE